MAEGKGKPLQYAADSCRPWFTVWPDAQQVQYQYPLRWSAEREARGAWPVQDGTVGGMWAAALQLRCAGFQTALRKERNAPISTDCSHDHAYGDLCPGLAVRGLLLPLLSIKAAPLAPGQTHRSAPSPPSMAMADPLFGLPMRPRTTGRRAGPGAGKEQQRLPLSIVDLPPC